MKLNHSESCILGETLVNKILSVLDSNLGSDLLNDKDAETSLISEINDRIQSTSDLHLNSVVQRFFTKTDAVANALAFDVIPEHIEALKQGFDLKSEHLISCTRKVLMLIALDIHTTLDDLNGMVNDLMYKDKEYPEQHNKIEVEAA